MNKNKTLYQDDHLIIRPHSGTRVAVQVGMDPETATPTVADAAELNQALAAYLRSEDSDE